MMKSLFSCAVLIFSALNVQAQDDEVVNLSTTITGNQEQPKVLYIVPWKQTEDNTILEQPLESKFSDVFAHVEREEHAREVEFIDALVNEESE